MRKLLALFFGLIVLSLSANPLLQLAVPSSAAPLQFFWDFETATPNSGALTDGPTFGGDSLRSTAQAYAGTYSFASEPTTNFSIVQLFNDTTIDEWGAVASTNPKGKVSFRLRWPSFTDGGQLFQLDGKSNDGGLDTNDGVSIELRSQGGAVDNGLRLSYGGDNGVTAVTVNTTGLDMSADTWYLVEIYFDRGAGIDSTKTLKIDVDGINYGSSTAALASMTCAAFHHINIGADIAAAVPMFIDDFRVEALDTASQRPGFVAKGTAVNNGTGANLTPTLPSHETNDILFVQVNNDDAVTVSTATSGWAQIGSSTNISAKQTSFWWKRAASASETSPTFTGFNELNVNFAQAYSYRGAITTGTPWDDAIIAGANSTTPMTSEIVTTGPNRAIVVLMNIHDNTLFDVGPPPAGWEYSAFDTTDTLADARMMAITTGQGTAGTVAAVSVGTLGTTEVHVSLTLALIPE